MFDIFKLGQGEGNTWLCKKCGMVVVAIDDHLLPAPDEKCSHQFEIYGGHDAECDQTDPEDYPDPDLAV